MGALCSITSFGRLLDMTAFNRFNADLGAVMLQKGYVSSRETTRRIGKSIATVYHLVKQEKLKAVRIGRSYFISLESIKAYLGPEADAILNAA